MRYHKIIFDSNPEITGLIKGGPQVEINRNKFSNEENYLKLKGFFMSLKYWKFDSYLPDFPVIIENAELQPSAKMTDFIHFSPFMFGCPFIMSNLAVQLFEQFELASHYYYDVLISGNGIKHQSKMLYMPYQGFEIVDFKKSTFSQGHAIQKNISNHKFNSQKEWQEFPDNALLHAKEIMLNEKFNKKLHLFNSRLGGLFASDELRSKIETKGLTGITFLDQIAIA